MDDQDTGTLSPWGEEETLGAATTLPWGESVTEEGGRVFLLAEHDPLPEGVKEGDQANDEHARDGGGRKCRVFTLNREARPSRPAIPASRSARGIA